MMLLKQRLKQLVFSLIESIYVFLSASTQRWSAFKEKVTFLTLKPLSDSGWESRMNSVRALRYQVGDVYDVLMKISLNSAKNATTRNEAKFLAKKIKNFKFMVSLILWYGILNRTNSVSKLLQNPNLNILEGTQSLKGLHTYFLDQQNEEQFKKLVVNAGQLAKELEMKATFMEEERVRSREKTVFLVTKVSMNQYAIRQQNIKLKYFTQ
ncbi:hypothetical protein ILUMI_05505 [Ignelater luminosus]|uniref:Uncharacterized protein n=1 Tax=Ignelater luminosus TaxID=2038154 RepID=A0A8K0DCV0_IGNLU|nr:hypothetical protein ILUMI_05505 [Ignelater luminosus]